eukprot:gnl/MRDRNA2_/MRDRNA2_91905_c0_seq1.p1 gnl/MRDRNA2_/MRDRNA2_91905_c0~~gnl/MRDRNA2_/MRDRNA2_91905_c0_seq1.p1  ORF type:complete len:950 (-),score=194.30 gnl/MRDRNA2_/MRDRNA2_91905_c0_seq1:335-3184(-)
MIATSALRPMCLPACAASRAPSIPRRPRNRFRARSHYDRSHTKTVAQPGAITISLPWPVPRNSNDETWPALQMPALPALPIEDATRDAGQEQEEPLQEHGVLQRPRPPDFPKPRMPSHRLKSPSPTPNTETKPEPSAMSHRALRRPNTAPTNRGYSAGRPLPWSAGSGTSTLGPAIADGRRHDQEGTAERRTHSADRTVSVRIRPPKGASTAAGIVDRTVMRRSTRAGPVKNQAKSNALVDKEKKKVAELKQLAESTGTASAALTGAITPEPSDFISSMSPFSTSAQEKNRRDSQRELEAEELEAAEKEKSAKEIRDAAQKDREKAWGTAFKRCQADGEIHRDQLMEAIQMIGFPKPQQSWINAVLNDSETHYSTLSLPEFQEFVRGYEQKQRQAFAAEFKKFDADDSGQVDVGELKQLLTGLGIMPLPAVLASTIAEVDEDGTGQLDVDEFDHVLELLFVREGFTKTEVEDLQRVFSKFDRDNSGEVSSNELMGILSWLGYPSQPEAAEEIAKEVDADGSGQLCWAEFLTCMRRFRERETYQIHTLMTTFDTDGSGTVDRDKGELTSILSELGYSANPEAIAEAAADAHIAQQQLSFEDLWQLLRVYRGRSGFTRNEETVLMQTFSRYDYKSVGQISTLEVGKALRILGYAAPIELQRFLVSAVDVDHSGQLDFAEFRTLMAMRRENELKEMSDAFKFFLHPNETLMTYESGQLQRALRKVGCSEADVMLDEKEVSFFGFVKIVDRARNLVRDRMRKHAGFNDMEVQEYRARFASYDNDGSGDIGGSELRELLGEILPAASFSMKHRARLERLLKEADEDGNGTLDFGDFLRLMRHHHDDCDREELEKIDKAIHDTGFSDDEAQQFRTIFEEVDVENAGHIGLSSIQKMLHGVCPLYRTHIAELTALFNEVTGRDGYGEVDFPDFLRVMRKVLDVDLAGIKNWTANPV